MTLISGSHDVLDSTQQNNTQNSDVDIEEISLEMFAEANTEQNFTIQLGQSNTIGETISESMFGGNFLFHKDGLGNDGTFDDVAENLGVTNLRYPGGSVTEDYFDIENPNNTSVINDAGEPVTLTPLNEFMAYAGAEGNSVTIVIPTRNFLTTSTDSNGNRFENVDMQAIKAFIKDVLAGVYGDADISAFEIGNEFSGSGQMSATEYGRVASALTRHIDAAIEEYIAENQPLIGWVEPSIAVQAPFFSQSENQDILDEFSAFEITKVDAVVTHFYSRNDYSDITDGYNPKFNNLDTWQAETQQNIDYFITEWNAGSPDSPDDGLRQASVILEMMQRMIAEGVDAANIWAIQQNNQSDLSGPEGVTNLTAAGEVFRWMSQSLIGSSLLDITSPNTDIDIHAFQGDGRVIVFISSRTLSQTNIDLDFDSLIPDYSHVFGQNLGVLDDISTPLNEGNPENDGALPYITTFNEADLVNGTGFSFSLGAYEIMFLEFTLGMSGVEISGHDQTINNPIANYDDSLVGSSYADTLSGFSGNDTLNGGAGDDTLDGGIGFDTASYVDAITGVNVYLSFGKASGGDGNDTLTSIENLTGSDFGDRLMGAPGDNTLSGGKGNDVIKGKGGTDELYGNDGDDKLIGGVNNDVVFGGAGIDVVSTGSGLDTVSGGEGNDNIHSGADADSVSGGLGDDKLMGGKGDDLLSGGAGNDFIYGGKGNDTLTGDAGNDGLFGGNNVDTFIFGLNDGSDKIKDWEDGIDLIDISAFGFTDLNNVLAIAHDYSNGVRLEFAGGEQLLIEGFTSADLNAGDFIFV